jgi:hypothetical protein
LLGSALDAAALSVDLRAPAPTTALAADSATPPDSGAHGSDLGPTTDVPWNPPAPVSGSEPWETALRLPGQIASFPLVGLGYAARHTMLEVERASLVPRVIYLAQVLPRSGLYLMPASLGDRTGLGVTASVAPARLGRALSVSTSVSTRHYSSSRVAASLGPAEAEYGYDWRPEERFFGLGLRTSDEETSVYAAQSEHLKLTVRYPWSREGPAPRAQVRAWAGQRRMVERTGREDEIASYDQTFPGVAGALDRRIRHWVYGVGASLDRRAGAPHWSRGYRLAAAVDRFDKPEVIDGTPASPADPPPQFTRARYQAEWGFSFMRDPRTVRLAATAVDQRLSQGSGEPLVPDLATLGGSQGLAGFEAGRFHDLDALALKASYIFPLAEHFELDVHVEGGGVYRDLWNDARLNGLRGSYGAALRPRLKSAPLGSVGVDWSAEKVRIRYSIGGVE